MDKTVTTPTTPGESVVDGVGFVISASGTYVLWRSDCEQCVAQGKGSFAPDHDAMRGCRSGRANHCTCDGCF